MSIHWDYFVRYRMLELKKPRAILKTVKPKTIFSHTQKNSNLIFGEKNLHNI